MDRLRLKNDAKQDLQYRLWEAFLPFLIVLLINWFIESFSMVSNRTSNYTVEAVFGAIAAVFSIAWLFLSFPIEVGIRRYYLAFIKKGKTSVTDIFCDLKNSKLYWEELKAFLGTGILIVLGLVFFIVPGVYLALLYSQLKYVFAEHPEYTASQAIDRAKDLMRGQTSELFILWFSFFFWYLLVAITFGIASVYVMPYTTCSYTRYYKSLCFLRDGAQDSGRTEGGHYGDYRSGTNERDGSGSDYNQNGGFENGESNRNENNPTENTRTENGDFVNFDGGIISGGEEKNDENPFDETR
jgi:uncharacterized membrane protein